MEIPDDKENAPHIGDTLFFGGITCFIWFTVFIIAPKTWPPSVLSISMGLLGVAVGLILIGQRLQEYDATTRTLRKQDRSGCTYHPIFAKLAPFGGVFGMVIASYMQYRMGNSTNLILFPIGIVVGMFLTWMVIEHIIYASSQGSRK